MNACSMHRYFTQMRSQAILIMNKAYSGPKTTHYPLEDIIRLLAFEGEEEVGIFPKLLLNLVYIKIKVEYTNLMWGNIETIKPGQQKGTLGPVGLITERKQTIQTYRCCEVNVC